MTAAERFWPKVNQAGPVPEYAPHLGPCWLWTGCIIAGAGGGYGQFKGDERVVVAHRFAYELLVGPVPVGLTLDHLCRVRACVRPSHVEPVTVRENTLRGMGPAAINARKTECINGHSLDDAYTGIESGRRWRSCRSCKRIQNERRDRRSLKLEGAVTP